MGNVLEWRKTEGKAVICEKRKASVCGGEKKSTSTGSQKEGGGGSEASYTLSDACRGRTPIFKQGRTQCDR